MFQPILSPHVGDALVTVIREAIGQPQPPSNTKHVDRYFRKIQPLRGSPGCDGEAETYLLTTVHNQLIDHWAVTARLKYCPELIRDMLIDRERDLTIWLNDQLKMYLATKASQLST